MALLDFFKKSRKEKALKAPKRGSSDAKRDKKKIVEKEAGKKKSKSRTKEALEHAILKESKMAWRILREPHVTEKSADLTQLNQYVFKVLGNPSKPEVKKAIEETHSVHVEKIRKISVPGKSRRRGRHLGWKSGYNKMIVKLKEGEKIEVLPH